MIILDEIKSLLVASNDTNNKKLALGQLFVR
jgi:hypothetical protein